MRNVNGRLISDEINNVVLNMRAPVVVSVYLLVFIVTLGVSERVSSYVFVISVYASQSDLPRHFNCVIFSKSHVTTGYY